MTRFGKISGKISSPDFVSHWLVLLQECHHPSLRCHDLVMMMMMMVMLMRRMMMVVMMMIGRRMMMMTETLPQPTVSRPESDRRDCG